MFASKIFNNVTTVMTILIVILSGVQPVIAASSNDTNQVVALQAELHHFSLPEGTCESGICTYTTHGYGTVNIMGTGALFVSATINFVWDFNTTPCSTLDPMEYILVGPTGSISILGSGSLCPGRRLADFPEFFSGVGQITGGTGEFSGITGSVTSQGILGPNGPMLHISGSVSY
jgi:hypothetical protein